jgi:carbonic anhydrase
MKELLQGIQEFQSSYFAENRDLFEELGHGQSPRVLFITCSDSRIVPSLITHSDPGDLFVIRNAGNIIPPFGAANGGEGAAVEYAINALNITQIIVCGHNHCGAMKGLLKLNKLQEDMPLVYDWLKHTDATRRLLKDAYSHLEGEDQLFRQSLKM